MRYEFGSFRLDTDTFVLLRNETPIPIAPKALRTLIILVENAGQVVSKEQILQSVWEEVTVEEPNLTQNIFALRKVLGEKPRDHRFIVTVPGKGYRFVAEVKPYAPSSALDESSALNIPPEAKTSPRFTYRPALVVVALVLSAGATVLSLRRKQDSPREYSAVPLMSYLGTALSPSFAPEGERVAFSWDGEKQDNFDIYVKQIGLGLPLRLTTDPRPDVSPAWSRDGRTIAFLRLSSYDEADVLLIPSATNGPERRIAEIAAPYELNWRVRFLSWSPDGKWLLVPDRTSAGSSFSLYLISMETGEKRKLGRPPPWNDDFSPALSPDLAHLVFARYTGVVSDLYTVDLSKNLQPVGEPKPLTSYHQQTSSPVWTQDGREVLFTRHSSGGSPSIWRIKVSADQHPEPVPISADNALGVTLSPRETGWCIRAKRSIPISGPSKRQTPHYGLAGTESVNSGLLRIGWNQRPSSRPMANRLLCSPPVPDGARSGSPTATVPIRASSLISRPPWQDFRTGRRMGRKSFSTYARKAKPQFSSRTCKVVAPSASQWPLVMIIRRIGRTMGDGFTLARIAPEESRSGEYRPKEDPRCR
jgi:DNA-binding winged helix-turn-helix (wHTH) protein